MTPKRLATPLRCLSHELGEIVVSVKTPVTRNGTERPHAPSLQLNIDIGYRMCRIGGRYRSGLARVRGIDVEIPPFLYPVSNPAKWGTLFDG